MDANRGIERSVMGEAFHDVEGPSILELVDVHSGYGEVEVIKGASFKVHAGDLLCIIGNNGAGKSTLLKTIFGQIRLTQGKILFMGDDISQEIPATLLRRGISMTPQGRCNFPEMTVRENLEIGAYIRTDSKVNEDIELMMERFPVLGKKQKEFAGNLSGGEQQILEMACALLLDPRLFFLDEPSLGLAPMLVTQVFSAICDINMSGTTIILVEQNAKQALEIANRAIVLDLGLVWKDDLARDIKENPNVKRRFLGETVD